MNVARRTDTGPSGGAPLARAGAAVADLCERYFPDALVFALAAVLLVLAAGLALGETPVKLVGEFGRGFWGLVPFTMQMALVIIGGFVVASSPPLARLIRRLARVPKTARGAVASRRPGPSRALFHAPQCGQRPNHLGLSFPHSAHKKTVFASRAAP